MKIDDTFDVTCGGQVAPFRVTYDGEWGRDYSLKYDEDTPCVFEFWLRNTSDDELVVDGLVGPVNAWYSHWRFEATECKQRQSDQWRPCTDINLEPEDDVRVRMQNSFDDCERSMQSIESSIKIRHAMLASLAGRWGTREQHFPWHTGVEINFPMERDCPSRFPNENSRVALARWLGQSMDGGEEGAVRIDPSSLDFFAVVDASDDEVTEPEPPAARLGRYFAFFTLSRGDEVCIGLAGYDRDPPFSKPWLDGADFDGWLATERLVSHGVRCVPREQVLVDGATGFWAPVQSDSNEANGLVGGLALSARVHRAQSIRSDGKRDRSDELERGHFHWVARTPKLGDDGEIVIDLLQQARNYKIGEITLLASEIVLASGFDAVAPMPGADEGSDRTATADRDGSTTTADAQTVAPPYPGPSVADARDDSGSDAGDDSNGDAGAGDVDQHHSHGR